MSSASRIALAFSLLLGSAVLAHQAVQKAPGKPTKELITRWIVLLGDNDFNVREEASQKLWDAGDAAEPALQEAAKSEDAEVARRARELLDKFKWGIYPDTPKAVVELITRYQGAGNERGTLIQELIATGQAGCKAVLKIIAAEDNPEARKVVLAAVSSRLSSALPLLLAEKDFTTLETLLAAGMESDSKTGLSNAVAYWLLRGQLDQKIAHYKALESKGQKPRETAEVLAYLYRARGDLSAAREAAKKADRNDLVEGLLVEAGAWKELVQSPELFTRGPGPETFGYRAAYNRWAGNQKEADEALAEVRKLADNTKDPEGQLNAAKVLFVNQRPREAMEVLRLSPANAPTLFEILAAQQKYREALALVDSARAALNNLQDENEKKTAADTLARLEVLQARTLFSLGEKDRARPLFVRLAGEIKADSETIKDPEAEDSWIDLLIESENRVGLTDEAFEHAGRVLALSNHPRLVARVLGKLFPSRSDQAATLLTILKAIFPQDDVPGNLKRLREALAGKIGPKELGNWITNAEAMVKARKPEDAELWFLALAEAALAGKQEELARQCLEKGDSPRTLLKLGDLLAGKKEWDQAARRYFQAAEKDRQQPSSFQKAHISQALPLYLSGKALVQAGQEKEGRERIEQAHWLPLGNEVERAQFGDGLSRRGETEALRRENDLLLRLGQPNSYYVGDALRRLAIDAAERKDLLKAADYQERAVLRVMNPLVNFVSKAAYVGVPALICRQRASGLLLAGKTAEALPLIALCQEMMPGNVDLAILVAPALEAAGKKKEAEELFRKTIAVYEELCKEYPKCSWTHNSIAWTAACCKRDLDLGLEHARKAVELAPQNPGHMDTLAEVYFQRGDKAKAIETQKKVIELEPNRAYFRKQLKRIEAGDPKAPLPAEEDEDEGD